MAGGNTLMFQVAVKDTVDGLEKVKEQLKRFNGDAKELLQIHVKVDELEAFTKALQEIGNGKQLRPLLEEIKLLQDRMAAFADTGKYFDLLRAEAAAAAKEVERTFKMYENEKKLSRSAVSVGDRRREYEAAVERQARAQAALASAEQRIAEERAAASAKSAQDVQNVTNAVSQLIDGFQNLHKVQGQGTGQKTNAIQEEIAALEKRVSEITAQYEQLQKQVQNTTETITQQKKTIQETTDANAKSSKEQMDSETKKNLEAQRQIKLLAEIQAMYEKISGFSSANTGLKPQTITAVAESYSQLAEILKTTPPTKSLQEISAMFGTLKIQSKEFFDQVKQGSKSVENLRNVRLALKAINEQMLSGNSSPKLEALRQQLQAINKEMHNMMKSGDFAGVQSLFSGHKGMSDGALNIIRQAVNEMKKFTNEAFAADRQVRELTESEQRFANAVGQATDKMRGQSQVLNDLKMMAYQYLSLWGAQNFINKIIETGGLLEQQRLSLSAILGDMDKANELFGQVKALALKSPFGVVQIDQMTKQLAAYGFEYEELFDWTKRLGDISAATGTEVSRLALALGHVRSEGALSGYTLRQFAMGNVPLLKMLSEARGVSTKEIRDLVRKKEISDKEVQDILMQLTNEGGRFYNAQEVMSEALNAKFKNLRDSFDIMFGEIAESEVGDAFKGLAETLTNMSRQWERFGRDILIVGGVLGSIKLATIAYNTVLRLQYAALGKNTAATYASAMASKKQEVALLKLARRYRTITAEEEYEIMTKKKLNASNIATLMYTKKLSMEEIKRAIAVKKLTKEEAIRAVNLMQLRNQIDATTASEMARGILEVKTLGRMRRAWLAYGAAIKSALGILATVGFAVAVDLWSRRKQQKDDAQEMADETTDNILKGLREIAKVSETLKQNAPKSTSEYADAVKQMTDALEKGGKYNEDLKNQVDSVSEVTEKYKILKGVVDELALSYGDLSAQMKEYLNQAYNVGGGWFSDDMGEDLKQFNDSLVKAKIARDVVNNQYIWEVRKAAKEMLGKDNAWVDNADVEDIYSGLAKRGKYLNGYHLSKKANNAYLEYVEALTDFDEDKEEIDKQMNDYAEKVAAAFTAATGKKLEDADNKTKLEFYQFAKDAASAWVKDIEGQTYVAHATVKLFVDMSTVSSFEVKEKEFEDQLDKEVEEATKGFFSNIVFKPEEDVYRIIRRIEFATDGANGEKNPGMVAKTKLHGYAPSNVKAIFGDIKTLSEAEDKLSKQIKEDKRELKLIDEQLKNEKLTDAQKEELKKGRGDLEERLKVEEEQYGRFKFDPKKLIERGTSGSGEDKDAKRLRERVRILKEAKDSYEYWRKAVGDTKSVPHVEDEFGQLLSEQGFEFKNIEHYKETLKDLKKEYTSIYEATGKKRPQLLEAIKEIDKILADIGRKDFEKKVDETVSKMKFEIDELTRKWETFNSVRESTGDEALASRLSGISPGATPADLKRALMNEMYAYQFDYDSILGMSDEEIGRYVEGLWLVDTDIKAVKDGLKDWKKAQQDLTKNDLQNYAKWLGGLKDYQTKLLQIQWKYNQALEETKRLLEGGHITKDEANARNVYAMNQMNAETWRASGAYANLYNNAHGMARTDFKTSMNIEIGYLNEELKNGAISAEDFTDKIKKLNDIEKELSENSFLGIRGGVGAFLSGGSQGLQGWYNSRAETSRMNYASAINTYGVNSQQAKEAKDQWEKDQKMADSFEKTTKQAEKLTKAFQDISNAANMLSNMFEELGMEGAANGFGDAAGVLGGIAGGAQSLSGLGPWGMAAGAAIGGITSIAQLHDKQQQRLIDALKENTDSLEANNELIRSSRSRTLGYDTGSLRRYYANLYSGNDTTKAVGKTHVTGMSSYVTYDEVETKSAAQKAMYDYYNNASSGNGYKQELKNLKELRKSYIDMYNAENEKKKKSKESLNEYKKKIAELDEQIMFYIEDLAKELWSLDIKGWSSQISDAIMTAFENGTSAATAFKDTVQDILKSIVKQMLQIGVIEPLLKRLQRELFGEIDENGNFTGGIMTADDLEDPEKASGKILNYVMDWFEKGEGQILTDYNKFMNSIEDRMNQRGYTMKGGSSSTVEGIRSTASEETTGIVAGYLATIRQDVSANRIIMTNFAEELWPDFVNRFDTQRMVLDNTFKSVRAIEDMMMYGKGEMFNSISRMSKKIDMAITADGRMRT